MVKWKNWFGTGCKGEKLALSHSTHDKLNETIEMLERRKVALQEKVAIENDRYKGFTKFKNKKAAMECLRRKSFYETQLEQIENCRSRVTDQMRRINSLTL
ncbi:hypothetical protein IFM89_025636 [Coptis chinensis]|uniref:Uncharacterized protein n=1 Tax=Coptis chinensis TaxID=261450 RepID=A0A835H5Y2_9MAGN|nr:hypothetical protein IFM89_007353 [Coptis chinensis]KAF9593851.1 hypothetical protein IFM89_025636 [Coptis chinensis]